MNTTNQTTRLPVFANAIPTSTLYTPPLRANCEPGVTQPIAFVMTDAIAALLAMR